MFWDTNVLAEHSAKCFQQMISVVIIDGSFITLVAFLNGNALLEKSH